MNFDDVLKQKKTEAENFSFIGFRLNENEKVVHGIVKGLVRRDGHCPCQQEENENTRCPCIQFVNDQHCCCNLFVKD